ncbi:MAG: ATP-dependent DNA helicase, partial [Lachnospiraceae bacterium]|nr:ATP-dependent DNA helicase [Lachnospiraceae bacterium]
TEDTAETAHAGTLSDDSEASDYLPGGISVDIKMTYVNLDSEAVRQFTSRYHKADLDRWFDELVADYYQWEHFRAEHVKARNASAAALAFPFEYRKGQRELVAAVYHALHAGRQLFVEAPTGVGKTMSTVFPAVRTIAEGRGDRLFYLTARTVTRQVAVEAFRILSEKGLDFKYVVLMAKEKICPMREPLCDPEHCPYAKGHFDRINAAVFDLLTHESCFDEEVILKKAREAMVCPFELALDTADWADGVVCDYNYVFDPTVRLKRFFGDGVREKAVVLVDEAHNLVDRGRAMYSAFIIKEHVMAAQRIFKNKAPRLEKSLRKLNKQLLDLKHDFPLENDKVGQDYQICASTGGIELQVQRILGDFHDYFENEHDGVAFSDVADFFFELRDFLTISDMMDERYVINTGFTEAGEFVLRLSCMNPAKNLQEVLDKTAGTIFFSATLLPMVYYKNLFSTREDDYAVYAETPFRSEQRAIFIGRDVSTRYKVRGEMMYQRIARYIHDTVVARRGNYMAFFPSYKMMEDVLAVYRRDFDEPDVNWIVQARGMYEMDREIFLENFYEDPRQSLVGFCVMGGIFAEGIDLIGSKLIGAIVVGTGLPQIAGEREIIRQYYDEAGENGFDFAYRIPGMNKVMQAAGRVIRTLEDKGVIVLLDDRFLSRDYHSLFPREWVDAEVTHVDEIGTLVKQFWKEKV